MYLKEETIICDTGNDNVGQILSKKVIKQDVNLDKTGLVGISLKFGTYKRLNTSKLKIFIEDFHNKKINYETELDCRSLDDGYWKTFNFPEYIFKNTKKIVISVSSLNSKINDSVTLFYDAKIKGKFLTIWDRKFNGSLNLKLIYKEKINFSYPLKLKNNFFRILYVTNTSRRDNIILDPSVRYRCYNFSENLSKSIYYFSKVININNLKFEDIYNYDFFVFHRPSYSEKLEKVVDGLIKLDKKFYADYDDLIFDSKFSKETSIFKNNIKNLKETNLILDRNKKSLLLFNNFFVSTYSLKDKILDLKPNSRVIVLPNGLTEKWLDISSKLKNYNKNTNKKIIGYFSGTNSHNRDFELISKTLFDFINNEENTYLLIVGVLTLPSYFKSSKIIKKDILPFYEMPYYISQCDLTISPLEKSNFNNCKSKIKFIESMSCGVPCLSSPSDDMLRSIGSGSIIVEENNWSNNLNNYLYDNKYKDEKIKMFDNNLDNFKIDKIIKIIEKEFLK